MNFDEYDHVDLVYRSPAMVNETYLGIDDPEFRAWMEKQPNPDAIYRRYHSLELVNRGTHLGKFTNKQRLRSADDWWLASAMCSQLEMSHGQQNTVTRIVQGLDLREYSRLNKRLKNDGHDARGKLPLLCLALCILTHNEFEPDETKQYYPGRKLMVRPKWDAFGRPVLDPDLKDRNELIADLVAQYGYSDETVLSAMGMLRGKLPHFRSWREAGAS